MTNIKLTDRSGDEYIISTSGGDSCYIEIQAKGVSDLSLDIKKLSELIDALNIAYKELDSNAQ